MSVLLSFLLTLRSSARSRVALQFEILALQHQLQVLQRARLRRLRLAKADRWLSVALSRVWTEWRAALVIVQPEIVIARHRRGFRVWADTHGARPSRYAAQTLQGTKMVADTALDRPGDAPAPVRALKRVGS